MASTRAAQQPMRRIAIRSGFVTDGSFSAFHEPVHGAFVNGEILRYFLFAMCLVPDVQNQFSHFVV